MEQNPEAPGLARIGQISMTVKDLDRAIAFYRDRLGMRFLFRAPNLAFFDCDGIRLMLGPAEDPEFDHPGSVLYYVVEGLEAVHEALLSRGVTFRAGPHKVADLGDRELWMAFFEDGEGNLGAAMEERAPS
jgi:methylmalonyl-CoA/ethylmalonyl-CoA epimerase